MSVPDPAAAAKFYCEAFDMKIVGETDSPLASGIYVSDGTISLALLNYKADEWAGMDKNSKCINHIGFWVDDLDEQSDKIKKNGGSFFRELPLEKESLYYEMKFRDPNGIIFDISHNGWVGAKK
jgi:methylmalonyl-CoA/ethylmalonyl-CoA epimerase